jgi:hypothetical protein
MIKMMLALAAFCSAGAAVAQTPAGQGVPTALHGRYATNASACSRGDETPGVIEVDNNGYSGASGNAAVLKRGRVLRGIHYFDVVFSADGDRQWQGRLAMRLRGNALAVSTTSRGRTRSTSYVRCAG